MKQFFKIFISSLQVILLIAEAVIISRFVFLFASVSWKDLYVQNWSKKVLKSFGISIRLVNPDNLSTTALFVVGNNILTELFNYTVDINIGNISNINTFDVYINDDYYGSDLTLIQINTNDRLRIEVIKNDDTKESLIELNSKLI